MNLTSCSAIVLCNVSLKSITWNCLSTEHGEETYAFWKRRNTNGTDRNQHWRSCAPFPSFFIFVISLKGHYSLWLLFDWQWRGYCRGRASRLLSRLHLWLDLNPWISPVRHSTVPLVHFTGRAKDKSPGTLRKREQEVCPQVLWDLNGECLTWGKEQHLIWITVWYLSYTWPVGTQWPP